jgi:hypothetical protein
MRNEELSIGNYVFAIEIEGSEDQACGSVIRYPVQIDTIYGDTILDNYGSERDIESLQPIPITGEILEQQGFEKHGENYGIYDDYFDFELHEYSDGVWLVTYHCCEMNLPDSQVEIGWLHELQRLMVMFAIDNEIILFEP